MKIVSLGDFLAAICLICLIAFSHTVWATENKPVNVCFEEWPPFIETTENGELEGLIVPALERLRTQLSMEVKLFSAPYLRCYKGIEKGTYDAILMEDNGRMLLSSNFRTAYWELSLLTRKGRFKDLQDFLSYQSGRVIFSFEYEYSSDVLEMFAERFEYGNAEPETMENWLKHDRTDAILEDTSWLVEVIEENGWDEVEILYPPVYRVDQYLNIHPRRKDFLDEVNAIVEAEKLNEEVEKLF